MSVPTRNHEDLPILEDLGRDLSVAFHREERSEQAARNRRRLRRLIASTLALFVIVPSSVVVATRWIWAPDPGPGAPRALETGKPIVVAEGRGEALQWRISAWMSDAGVCHEVATFTATRSGGRGGGACRGELPPEWKIGMGTSSFAGEHLIEGFVEPGVARVEVEATGQPRVQAQIVRIPGEVAERGRLPEDFRFYVATLPASGPELTGPESAVRVVALDASGRELDRRESGNVRTLPRR